MTANNRRELVSAIDSISRAAGVEILAVYQQSQPIEVSYKSDDSPLTEADQRAHKLIADELGRLTPKIPVLSEESAAISYQDRRSWASYWLVDPLDGTKEFLSRNGEFTVNIALIEQGIATMGVVHVPVSGLSYSGICGQGAWKQYPDAQAEEISSGCYQPDLKRITVAASRNHKGALMEGFMQQLSSQVEQIEMMDMGSSLKICLVAEGKVDLYPRLAPTCEWDTAAAHAVLTAAGGELVDTHFKALRYNHKQHLLNPHFYALADPSYPWQLLISQMP